jgi:DNA-binding transcriptional MerR regulator
VAKKLFYRIGEACKQLDIQPYVLRYWETEFPVLNPKKSKAGQRVYSEEELGLIRRIKQLLYEEGYTIAGAKKKLDSELALEASPDEEGGEPEAVAAPVEETPEVAASAAASALEEAPERAPGVLDSAAAQQVERLRSGVREALAQARELLRLLGD